MLNGAISYVLVSRTSQRVSRVSWVSCGLRIVVLAMVKLMIVKLIIAYPNSFALNKIIMIFVCEERKR